MKIYVQAGRARLHCPQASAEQGHLEATFVWTAGSEHVDHHQAELRCNCGKLLVHESGTDPWKHPFREVEGTPHGA